MGGTLHGLHITRMHKWVTTINRVPFDLYQESIVCIDMGGTLHGPHISRMHKWVTTINRVPFDLYQESILCRRYGRHVTWSTYKSDAQVNHNIVTACLLTYTKSLSCVADMGGTSYGPHIGRMHKWVTINRVPFNLYQESILCRRYGRDVTWSTYNSDAQVSHNKPRAFWPLPRVYLVSQIWEARYMVHI